MTLFLLACVRPLLAPAPPGVPEWPVDPAFTGEVSIAGATSDYYAVVGSDDIDLIGELRRRGPLLDGSAHGAATSWKVRWAYREPCRAEDIQVIAELSVLFPRWEPRADAPRHSVGNWQRYIGALAVHEQGHVDAILAVVARMPAVLAEGGCSEVDARGRDALDVIRAANAEYDRVTESGATQGAVLFAPILSP